MRVPALVPLLLLACAQEPATPAAPAAPTTPAAQPPPPDADHRVNHSPHLPSSLVEPSDRARAEQAKAQLRRAVEKGEKLYTIFGLRSRSPIVADALELRASDVVADIGAGTGAFELLLIEEPYPFDTLWAVDIDADALAWFDWALAEAEPPGHERVKTLHSSEQDVLLPPESVDKALLLNTPFYLTAQGAPTTDPGSLRCMKSLVDAIRPGGMLVMAERHVIGKEDSVKLEDDPAERCGAMVTSFTQLGLELRDHRMVKLDEPQRGAHCLVRLTKPAGLPLILGDRTLPTAGDGPPRPEEIAP